MKPRWSFLLAFASFLSVAACTPPPELGASDEELAAEAFTAADEDGAAKKLTGCTAERSCGKPTLVCKRPDEPRPCGAAGCVDMQFRCEKDADCLEGYACSLCRPGDPPPCGLLTGRCRPRACAVDKDCGSANVVCQAGACTHRACRTSRSCKGSCVAGACWNQPGWCHDTTLPPPP
jgi:hypothetical protein